MRKIGNRMKGFRCFLKFGLLILVSFSFLARGTQAADVPSFSASVDRSEISADQTVRLKLSVTVFGDKNLSEPEFDAPDFVVVSESSSFFVESVLERGGLKSKNTKQVIKFLQPKGKGELLISKIRLLVDGKEVTHPPIRIQVSDSLSQNNTGTQLKVNPPAARDIRPFFVKAEVDQVKVFKGQRMIVSYYLFQRVPITSIQVEKFPVFDGFFREDLELPVLGQSFRDRDSVLIDGIRYERILLARYGAYPLKDGRLAIDSMGVKGQYYLKPDADPEPSSEDDPFSGILRNFMSQLQPRSSVQRSESIAIDVQPLPAEGRPESFAGAVGEFELVSSLDKTSVKVNEAVSLTLKIDGTGNFGSVNQPSIKWPEGLEIYESKSKLIGGRESSGTKIFEILVVPRRSGKLVIPAQELDFFSPRDRRYKKAQSLGFELFVDGSASGSEKEVKPSDAVLTGVGQTGSGGGGLLLPEEWTSHSSYKSPVALRMVRGMIALTGVVFAGLFLHRQRRRSGLRKSFGREIDQVRRSRGDAFWLELKKDLQSLPRADWSQVVIFYHQLSKGVSSELESALELPARAYSRAELRTQMNSRVEGALWQRLENLLDYCDAVQFSGGIPEHEARERIEMNFKEAERIILALKNTRKNS